MQLSKPSKLPPREPCFVFLDGKRHIRGPIYERIQEPLQIVEVQNGKAKELIFAMTGRGAKFPISNFGGLCTRIVLDEEETK